MTRDETKIINSAERVMREFSKLCFDLRLAAPFNLPEDIALANFHDESRLYRLMEEGGDNGWALDMRVKARVSFLNSDGKVRTRTVTVYRIADRLADDGVADRMLDTLKDDLLTDLGSLEMHVISQIEIEMFKTDYAKH